MSGVIGCVLFCLLDGDGTETGDITSCRILVPLGQTFQAKAFLKTMPCCRDENQLALLVSRVTGREHEHRSVGTITIFGDLPAAF
jgi:hypothetical protein